MKDMMNMLDTFQMHNHSALATELSLRNQGACKRFWFCHVCFMGQWCRWITRQKCSTCIIPTMDLVMIIVMPSILIVSVNGTTQPAMVNDSDAAVLQCCAVDESVWFLGLWILNVNVDLYTAQQISAYWLTQRCILHMAYCLLKAGRYKWINIVHLDWTTCLLQQGSSATCQLPWPRYSVW